LENALVLVMALALDLLLGELPSRFHPVAWTGSLIATVFRLAPRTGPRRQFVFGLAVVLVITVVLTALTWLMMVCARGGATWLYILAGALGLKQCFSWRGLREAALMVRRPLASGDLASARHEVRALVGRDTAGLGGGQLVSATVESVAENSCDSLVAPLFYFLFFGVPGAVAYRVINTFDSMVGHHGEYEYLGKAAARLDDVANFVPARLSALFLGLAAVCCRRNAAGAWRVMARDHRRTESPNAGWTMSAAAGALEVRLEKTGFYQVGDGRGPLSVATLDAALDLYMTQAALWCGLCVILEVLVAYFTQALAG
jgi:adenosylcobinamide-phosphate synthase